MDLQEDINSPIEGYFMKKIIIQTKVKPTNIELSFIKLLKIITVMKFVIPADINITPTPRPSNQSIDVQIKTVSNISFGQFQRVNKCQS